MGQTETDRREGARHPTEWDGECHVGEGYSIGLVRDISKRGMFFQPITEIVGIPREGAGEVPLLLRPGDRVQITYELRPSKREVTVPAVVRWVGTSHGLGEFGAGLELDGRKSKG